MTGGSPPQPSKGCSLGPAPLEYETALLLKGLQIGDHVIDLRNIKPKLRHSRMTGDNSFRQQFWECVDWIAFVQFAECGSYRQWALADTADSVALGAMRLHKNAAALGASVLGKAGCTRIRRIARIQRLRIMDNSLG